MKNACTGIVRLVGVGLALHWAQGTPTAAASDRDPEQPPRIDRLQTEPNWTAVGLGLTAAATAGDVNGDGYSDIVVGAPTYTNGQEDEGQALVYLGRSILGLSTVPSWTVESNQIAQQFGSSVAAGDVNGDGYDDVIIGARGENVPGKVFVYLGSPTGLSSSASWTAVSSQPGDYFGSSVASAGDVNGDGFADVIVGAFFHSNGQTSEGKVYLYLGSATGPSTSPSWTVESNQVGAGLGICVAGAGDVNGDGFSDVIVGADAYDNGQSDEGRAFVYHGSAAGLAASPSWVAESNQNNAYFARSVATAGDVNADGYADVIVGAAQYSNGQALEGRAYIYLGTSSGLVSPASWITESNQTDAHLGQSVATAGDTNGDGFADVIIGVNEYDNGQNQEGRVVVFNGAWPTPGNTPAWAVESNLADTGLGNTVAPAGDVNGDGFSDVIVATFTADVQVYHGTSASLHPTDAFRRSPVPGSRFGHAVAAAGDVDANGLFDVIVGAPSYGESAGHAYVLDANNTLFLTFDGGQPFAQFGNSVASAGDVNGDGFSDVIVGANLYENGQVGEGRAFVYHGRVGGPWTSPSWTAESNQAFAEFGSAVASAGDVNGDGYSDVIVGAYGYDNGQSDEGRVFVYHGSATGLASSPAWRAESNQASSGFGYAVASAGDVNRDGYSDVIVGAYLFDNGQTNEGRVFVYHGSATGLASSPSWTAESNQAIADFGIAVATAGDVNGDGYSDVIVGAPSYDNGQDGEGRAFVYLGSPTGLGSSPAWTAESNVLSAQFGYSVGTAGDVNGDGFSDVVVGAPFLTHGASDEGGAFVYQGSEGGLAANPAWIAEGEQAFANFGFSVATGGDLNGDGFSDVIVGAPVLDNQPGDDQGFCLGYYGNWDPSGFSTGFIRRIQQVRVDNTAAIHIQGNSDYQTAFRLKGLGSSPAGRDHVWLEWEVKPLGAAFNGQGIVAGQVHDTGAPMGPGSIVPLTEIVGGLINNTRYCWRARFASHSPFFPRGPWLVHSGNGLREADLRTTGRVVGVAESMPAAAPRLLEPIHPNPIGSPGEIAYSLPEGAQIRLAVYDVQGRLRAVLDRGMKPAGRHAVAWDGRAASGARLEAGVYLVRLELGDRTETRKLVWAP